MFSPPAKSEKRARAGRQPMREARPSNRAAFSLLELAIVLTLLLLLSAISFQVYTSIIQSTALTTGAGLLTDILTEAREDAVTKNMSVEVRLYDIAGAVDPTPAYRLVQLHWLESDRTRPAIHPPVFLPNPVVIDPTAPHSSLIAQGDTPAPDPADPRLNNQTRAFHFLADGSTDLDPTQAWFLTLRSATSASSAVFPSNWASLTIDPATGKVQVFRP